jgi:transcription termination/antitermination protein NusG
VTAQTFESGKVRIQEGVFRNFTGAVKDVDAERRTLKVSVTLFGRTVLIELPFSHVQEIG